MVLFRKAPADGTFTVTLGLAGYAEAYFDDFRVEVIEHEGTTGDSDVVQRRPRGRNASAPELPDPTMPAAAARSTDSRPRPR